MGDNVAHIYRITTKYEDKSDAVQEQYFKIDDWMQTGLSALSYIDTGTLIALARKTFKNKTPIGHLTENGQRRLLEFLNN